MPSKELDTVTVDGSIKSTDIVAYMENPSSVQIQMIQEDPDEVANRIQARLLGAKSAEELFNPPAVLHARDHLNKPFQFLSVQWRPSDLEGEGLPFYGVFEVADYDGALHVLTCGARNVVLKLAKADAHGWLPQWLKIVATEKKTTSGYVPLDVVSAPAPFKHAS